MSDKIKVGIVDDHPLLRQGVAATLGRVEDFEVVEQGGCADEAREISARCQPDVLLMDVNMPGADGFGVLSEIKLREETKSTPVLMLTGRSQGHDIVRAFDLGASDYVTKPFSPRELVLRIRKLLQRRAAPDAPLERFTHGDLVIDTSRHSVTWKGRLLDLTATEFRLLLTLVQRRGRVQSREALLRDVWQYDTLIDTRTVDTHMRRLREKLGDAARHLETIRGVGYRFEEA